MGFFVCMCWAFPTGTFCFPEESSSSQKNIKKGKRMQLSKESFDNLNTVAGTLSLSLTHTRLQTHKHSHTYTHSSHVDLPTADKIPNISEPNPNITFRLQVRRNSRGVQAGWACERGTFTHRAHTSSDQDVWPTLPPTGIKCTCEFAQPIEQTPDSGEELEGTQSSFLCVQV